MPMPSGVPRSGTAAEVNLTRTRTRTRHSPYFVVSTQTKMGASLRDGDAERGLADREAEDHCLRMWRLQGVALDNLSRAIPAQSSVTFAAVREERARRDAISGISGRLGEIVSSSRKISRCSRPAASPR